MTAPLMSPKGSLEPKAEGSQLSFFPLPCPCGEYPVEEEGVLFNWCRCEKLAAFKTAEEWNGWVMA